ncbi:hypothetical protein A3A39_04615 [Candidatus Kaiserbacteria bacterium RIFCSPLOWO2_01_FULL_54_13]|uniref:Type 4 fimbrial biogenesis protein PilX N-terminal domain-containing protein n=1 Tax=Candidatus Kaiserbacteria bacterium RIFCSPLOWO2_01_FULL_54_13 TaxID=1798512 RepID=A0A1F6F1R2_9BACT|nr:MAG: hypothetical protein A3A39_04615 [Candidatus Kaiserbacteria bacterium RIFCSPLOWO2_01_FULL_54_13]
MFKQKTDNRKQKSARTALRTLFDVRSRAERGFTILMAALVASIVLSLGTSIFGLVQKSLVLSSIGRDSQFAFYAADSGAECALYWDVRRNYFATSAPPDIVFPQPMCDGQSFCDELSDLCTRSGSYPQTMSFQLEPNSYCANITVEKSLDPDTGAVRTIVHADGFSRRCDSILDSSRVLQRSVELHY